MRLEAIVAFVYKGAYSNCFQGAFYAAPEPFELLCRKVNRRIITRGLIFLRGWVAFSIARSPCEPGVIV